MKTSAEVEFSFILVKNAITCHKINSILTIQQGQQLQNTSMPVVDLNQKIKPPKGRKQKDTIGVGMTNDNVEDITIDFDKKLNQ